MMEQPLQLFNSLLLVGKSKEHLVLCQKALIEPFAYEINWLFAQCLGFF